MNTSLKSKTVFPTKIKIFERKASSRTFKWALFDDKPDRNYRFDEINGVCYPLTINLNNNFLDKDSRVLSCDFNTRKPNMSEYLNTLECLMSQKKLYSKKISKLIEK